MRFLGGVSLMPASGGRPFCEYADEGRVLCARGAGSVYARPIESLMLDRLQDLFVCVCVCVMPCELGWEEEMERYDLHGKERKWQYELQAVFSCHWQDMMIADPLPSLSKHTQKRAPPRSALAFFSLICMSKQWKALCRLVWDDITM